MVYSFTFPGQGSQYIGMGKELYQAYSSAKEVFEEVDETLKQNLFSLMSEGDIKELSLTQNAQPALMAVSIAVINVLEKEANIDLSKKIKFVAGHSLGEYSALVASKVINLREASILLKARGNAMQNAVANGEGAMAALIGVNFEQAKEIAKKAEEGEVCQAANDNADGQIVISGNTNAINRALEISSQKNIRTVLLPVSVPAHSMLMKPAANKIAQELEGLTFKEPTIPIIQNVTANQVTDSKLIKKNLVEQMCGSVKWRSSVLYMKENGVESLAEIGAGKVLSGLCRRIDRKIKTISVESPQSIEKLVNDL